MYEYPLPQKYGIIKNFGRLSCVALLRMREDLGLSLTSEQLQKCSEYFRTNKLNDPDVNLLCFLDAFLNAMQGAYPQLAVTELSTPDKTIADTFANLVSKRRELYQPATSEIRLTSLTSVATDWLNRVSGTVNPTPSGLSFHAAPSSRISEAAHGLAPVKTLSSETGLSVSLYRRYRTNKRVLGASLLLLHPQNTDTGKCFDSSVTQALHDKSISDLIADMRPVCESGILGALLGMSNGAALNLSGLPERSEGGHFCADLSTMYFGCVVVTCVKGTESRLSDALSRYGIVGSYFGTTNSSSQLSVSDGNKLIINISFGMLLSLITPKAIKVTIPQETSGTIPSRIGYGGISPLNPLTVRVSANDREMHKDAYISSAVSDVSENPFTNAFYTVATAYLRAVASGCAVDKAIATISVHACDDWGRNIAAMLGTYRAQTELCLRTIDYDTSRHIASEGKSDFLVGILTERPSFPVPSKFAQADSNLWLLAPKMTDCGLPDPDELRGLARYIELLNRNHAILSSSVFGGTNLMNAVKDMERDCSLALSDECVVSDEFIPLGVIIETSSNCRLDGRLIGRTTTSHKTESPIERHRYKALVWSDKPQVFVPVVDQTADDLQELFNLVSFAGGECHVSKYDDSENGFDRLSADMLKAQVTVFTTDRDVTMRMLENERVAYAIDEYKRSGRMLLSLGQSIPALSDKGLLPPVSQIFTVGRILNGVNLKLTTADTPWLSKCPDKTLVNISDNALLCNFASNAKATVEIDGKKYCAVATDDSGLVAGAPVGCFSDMFSSAFECFL